MGWWCGVVVLTRCLLLHFESTLLWWACRLHARSAVAAELRARLDSLLSTLLELPERVTLLQRMLALLRRCCSSVLLVCLLGLHSLAVVAT